ncbi:MAG: hypothetical protein Q8P13_04220 [bacterium]|nr:hypothetical protein [bacterium]
MRNFCLILTIFFFFLFVAALPTVADVGVGVGTGKINVTEKLKPGASYTLPPMTVFNTGTVTATYKIRPAFNETQPQKKPDASWFSFSPENFTLTTKDSQRVTPRLSLPLRTPPGDYFVYLEAVPDKTVQKGDTSVGVAAATKLYFTVVPANLFMAILYWIISFYQNYAPFSYILTALFVFGVLTTIFRKYFNFSFRIQKKGRGS